MSQANPNDAIINDGAAIARLTAVEFNERLRHITQVLPISAAALDVYEMTQSLEWELTQIAAAVQRDAALTTEILRMANSTYYNPPGRPIAELDEAVMRIGQKRVGELALTVNALSSVTPAKVPWMDLELCWKRSMAAGIALELLVEQGGHEDVADGLFVSAILHPLGRIVLGMLFPELYAAMVAECARTGASLREIERRAFPATHADVMAELLADWRIAPEVFMPVKFSMDDYSCVARLLEPMRTKAELVKVAIFLGRLAVGRWESWDYVQFPPMSVLDRLGVREVEQLIRQTRSDVSRLAEFHPGGKPMIKRSPAPAASQTTAYCNFSDHDTDLLQEFLPALGLEVQSHSICDLRQFQERQIANCLGITASQFAVRRTNNISTIVTEAVKCEEFARYAPSIGLPNSFSRLRDGILAHVATSVCETAVR